MKGDNPISPEQEIQLQRLRLGSFNDMDGDLVADSLIKHRPLWDAFLFGRFAGNFGALGTLIELRDLNDGTINASTVMILTDKARWPKLLKIIEKSWRADEIGYTGADDTTWGTAPFATASDVCAAMGGGFFVRQVHEYDEEGELYTRVRSNDKKKLAAKNIVIPIVVRIWWD